MNLNIFAFSNFWKLNCIIIVIFVICNCSAWQKCVYCAITIYIVVDGCSCLFAIFSNYICFAISISYTCATIKCNLAAFGCALATYVAISICGCDLCTIFYRVAVFIGQLSFYGFTLSLVWKLNCIVSIFVNCDFSTRQWSLWHSITISIIGNLYICLVTFFISCVSGAIFIGCACALIKDNFAVFGCASASVCAISICSCYLCAICNRITFFVSNFCFYSFALGLFWKLNYIVSVFVNCNLSTWQWSLWYSITIGIIGNLCLCCGSTVRFYSICLSSIICCARCLWESSISLSVCSCAATEVRTRIICANLCVSNWLRCCVINQVQLNIFVFCLQRKIKSVCAIIIYTNSCIWKCNIGAITIFVVSNCSLQLYTIFISDSSSALCACISPR